MQNNKYVIKSLAPWMLDELLAFSKIASYEIVFLRKQSNFYDEGLQQLKDNGVIIHNRPKSLWKISKKIIIIIIFIFKNILKFGFDYNGVIVLKSLIWFLKLDLRIFSPKSKIHAQFATQAAIVSLLIKKINNNEPDFSFTFHAHDIYFKNKMFNLLVNNCKNAFSISNYNIDYVKSTYLESDKISLSRLGVFRESNQFIQSTDSKHQTFTLGLISWFVEKKGISFLLHAFLALKQQGYSDIRLILAGDGPLKAEYLEFIEKNQLSGTINYIGKIKGDDKRDFFHSLDAFILPSIALKNDQDGIPVVLMEAISFGLPIISTNVSGIPEICINDYNGFLVPEKNTGALVKAIQSLYKSEELRAKFSLNSLELSSQYDININSKSKLAQLDWI